MRLFFLLLISSFLSLTPASAACTGAGNCVHLDNGKRAPIVPAPVTAYGADPTGAADSTAAFTNALAANSHLYIPCGTYAINWTPSSSVTNPNVEGAGNCTYLKPYIGGSAVLTVSNGEFGHFRNFQVSNPSYLSGDGIVVTGPGGNHIFEEINASGFTSGNAFFCNGAISSPDGIRVIGGSYLYGLTGINWTNCGDGRISGVQIGGNSGTGLSFSGGASGDEES